MKKIIIFAVIVWMQNSCARDERAWTEKTFPDREIFKIIWANNEFKMFARDANQNLILLTSSDGSPGLYRYFFKTYNIFHNPQTGEDMKVYSREPEYNGNSHFIEEAYINVEGLNVCLAKTHVFYWPSFSNRIRVTAEEY